LDESVPGVPGVPANGWHSIRRRPTAAATFVFVFIAESYNFVVIVLIVVIIAIGFARQCQSVWHFRTEDGL
jgi:hypothetical protein